MTTYTSFYETNFTLISPRENITRRHINRISKHDYAIVYVLTTSILTSLNILAYTGYGAYTKAMRQVYTWHEAFGYFTQLRHGDFRSLFFFGLKLDVINILQVITLHSKLVLHLTSKFYLSLIVLGLLGILSSSSNIQSSGSFLSRFLNDNTVTPITRLAVGGPHTTVSVSAAVEIKPKPTILKHTVEEGDDLAMISYFYSISAETITYNNNIQGNLTPGQELYIPWSEGYIYQTEDKTSVQDIADLFGVDVEKVAYVNSTLSVNDTVEAGNLVLIPSTDFSALEGKIIQERERKAQEARLAEAQRLASIAQASVASQTYKNTFADLPSSTIFAYPATGVISRCVQPGHIACDIANLAMPPVFASHQGTVIRAGWDTSGYGNVVVIDHGIIEGVQYQTLYAHLNSIYVAVGQNVSQGESIGQMGSTGNSTGPHVHFEVIANGMRVNPAQYLP